MPRTIDKLRRIFPKEKWSYDQRTFEWHTADYSVIAYKVAVSAPKHDCDDSYVTKLKIVVSRKNDQVVLLKELPLF
jgi:hypothetical protein